MHIMAASDVMSTWVGCDIVTQCHLSDKAPTRGKCNTDTLFFTVSTVCLSQ